MSADKRDRPVDGITEEDVRQLCLILIFALPTLAVPECDAAESQWMQSKRVWSKMDRCAHEAQKKYPDYTRESNAKREAFRRLCLRKENLPGGDDPEPEPQQQPQQPSH